MAVPGKTRGVQKGQQACAWRHALCLLIYISISISISFKLCMLIYISNSICLCRQSRTSGRVCFVE